MLLASTNQVICCAIGCGFMSMTTWDILVLKRIHGTVNGMTSGFFVGAIFGATVAMVLDWSRSN